MTRPPPLPPALPEIPPDTQAGALPDADDPPAPARVRWPQRASEVGARPLPPAEAVALFVQAWQREPHVLPLADDELQRLAAWAQVVEVPAGRPLIQQDELGDYLLLVLDGTLLVERLVPGGPAVRLAEARAGDMLGEMSLLDSGSRFSRVATATACRIAVLQAEPFHRLMQDDPRVALALMAALSRRLSLRVRLLSARLGALLSPA